MTVMIAFLRGINVGSSGRVAMADLRAATVDAGFSDVSSYIQSGNLVFASKNSNTVEVAAQLRAAIARSTSVDPRVLVRTRDELRHLVRANPFSDGRAESNQLHVAFLPHDASDASASVAGVDLSRYLPEEAAFMGHNVYMHLLQGPGSSKLAAAIARHTQGLGTQRNWRVVLKLAEQADQLPESL